MNITRVPYQIDKSLIYHTKHMFYHSPTGWFSGIPGMKKSYSNGPEKAHGSVKHGCNTLVLTDQQEYYMHAFKHYFN